MKNIFFVMMLGISLCLASCVHQKHVNIYIAGDSTMADRYDTIETPERGWGQVLPTFLSYKATVSGIFTPSAC